jgi:predicted RNase H-like HicB family nuclease
MEKITVTVGMTEHNYSAHLVIGDGIVVATGKTLEELKSQMEEAVAFHLEGLREDGNTIPDVFSSRYELSYQFEIESLLQRYSGIFTGATLEKLTGINRRQLQRYASGASKPRGQQAKKN